MLNDEQLWDKCGTGQKITYEDIGLDPSKHSNAIQTYSESFELASYFEFASDTDILREIGISLIFIVGAIIALHIFIM